MTNQCGEMTIKNSGGFLPYMFASSERFSERHTTFDNMECVIHYKGKEKRADSRYFEELQKRKDLVKDVKELMASAGVDTKQKGLGLLMYYMPDEDDEFDSDEEYMDMVKEHYEDLINTLKEFTKDVGILSITVTHFDQLDKETMTQFTTPHTHTLYFPDIAGNGHFNKHQNFFEWNEKNE